MESSPPPPPPPPPQIAHLLSQFPIIPKPDPDGPIPPQTPIPVAAPPPLMLALTPELCGALHSSPDDDAFLAQCPRQSSSSTAAAAPPLPGPPPLPPYPPPQPPQQQPGAGGSNPPSSATNKRARPPVPEMVRVTNLGQDAQLGYRALVRRTRLIFEALRAAFQRQDPSSSAGAGARNRADLRASNRMLSAGHCLHRGVRIVGDIPGVHVGDAFYYRAELCVVGLHIAPQAGISYIPGRLVNEGHPVATSIVSSGGYLDDKDTGDVLVYTGSGGRQRNGPNHHADQKLERGNLALHNSYLYGVEVRVIRGHIYDRNPNRKVYVYDGLYKVVSSTFGPGKSGHNVCKFTLLRLPGQNEIGSRSWHTAKQLKEAMDSRIRPPSYISLDLSKGAEALRVPVCNRLDDDRSPLLFEYTVGPEFPVPPAPGPAKRQRGGCHCATGCGSKCRCGRRNTGGPAYNEDGTLVLGRPVVYECGALCGCPIMSCVNRVTQRGMKHRLEVFRSNETGWGVRALDLIPPGAFVGEYSGDVVVMDDHSGKALMEDRSIIDPNRFPERWREWGDASAVDPSSRGPQFAEFAGPGYLLDVSHKRNVACYISHSRTPNVFLQFVVRGNEDDRFPHLMVFAMETIPPMRELSIDYGIDG
ncbi:Histone-lysine N-methyltransferase family member SUVH9 [Dichanthelium oligosanthes]|uniref:Histone-lysine N-methyltransferase family member SUVH9 n=1 Tax=Dichanthelium oligosanthes TaxID=888268 RepID=A0A1E5W0Q4_9POAL|nr:Histone-lysine N-methyltransferase family member SUVH9 [Dichanthelium oligosanthes]